MPDFTTLVGKFYNMLYSTETTPTLTSGAGTGATITGTARAFTIVVGSSPGDTIVLGMPTSLYGNGWSIMATNQTGAAAAASGGIRPVYQSAGTTTSVSIVNALGDNSDKTAFVAGNVIKCIAWPY